MQKWLFVLLVMFFCLCAATVWSQESGRVVVPLSGEYITEWLVIGPFSGEDLDIDFLTAAGGEAAIRPKEGDAVTTSDGRTLTWKRYSSSEGSVDLLDAVGKHEHVTAYAFCEVENPRAKLEMLVGSDDGVKIWLNDDVAHQYPYPRSLTLDEDSLAVNLNGGMNRCLVKVSQGTGNWGFAVHFRDRNSFFQSAAFMVSANLLEDEDERRLEILAQRETSAPSVLWSLTSMPVRVSVLDGQSKAIGKFSTVEGQPFLWTIPASVQDRVTVIADLTDENGQRHAATATHALAGTDTVMMEVYDSSDGMVPGIVQCIYQDSRGDLWIGTTEGLSKYDGREFQNFTVRDQVPGIGAICEDESGLMWFGGQDKIYHYNGKELHDFSDQISTDDFFVSHILRDRDGKLWFNTSEGLIYYDEGFHRVGLEGMKPTNASQIMEDRHGNLWIGTESDGVFRYDGKNFQQFTTQDGLAAAAVLAILEDSSGDMWFGHHGGGTVSRYDGNKFDAFTKQNNKGFPMTSVRAIVEDGSGNLWFTGHEGLCRYDGKHYRVYTVKDGLPIVWTNEMIEDVEGNFWIGTWGAGVVRMERNFQNLGTGKPLKDKDGNIWCSLSNGVISRYDGKGFRPYLTQKDGIPKDASLGFC